MKARCGGILVLLMASLCAGCDTRGSGWTPVLESEAPGFLEEELGRTAAEVEEARERMGTAPAAAAAALERASGRLSGLAEVYLPLLRARAAATNAYRYYRLEDQHGALGALDRAERWILLIRRQPADLEAELEGLTEEIGRAREAVDQGLPEAVLHLERLAGTLTDVLGRDEIFP